MGSWLYKRSPALSGAFWGALATLTGWGIAYAIIEYRNLTPHYEYVCTSSRSEMTMMPMMIPNGNNGFTTMLQPTYVDVCTSGYHICSQFGAQVDPALCIEKKN
jgi:hypothetical protein